MRICGSWEGVQTRGDQIKKQWEASSVSEAESGVEEESEDKETIESKLKVALKIIDVDA